VDDESGELTEDGAMHKKVTQKQNDWDEADIRGSARVTTNTQQVRHGVEQMRLCR